MRRLSSISAVALGLLASTSFARVWYVPTQPYPFIQDVIDDPACVDGDEIMVFAGVDTCGFDFKGKAVRVYSEQGIDGSRLVYDPSLPCHVNNVSLVRAVSDEGRGSVLEGFTIMNGSAESGAGIYISQSSPTIIGCRFTNNSSRIGGAVFVENGLPRFDSCSFDGNSVNLVSASSDAARGGAVYLSEGQPEFENCTFEANIAELLITSVFGSHWTSEASGGAVCMIASSPVLTNCDFRANAARATTSPINAYRTALAYGGAVACLDGSDPLITSCTFEQNNTYANVERPYVGRNQSVGGAVSLREASTGTFTGTAEFPCRFSQNYARSTGHGSHALGGAVAIDDAATSPSVSHCVFNENELPDTSRAHGGAVSIRAGATPAFTHCEFNGNGDINGTAAESVLCGGAVYTSGPDTSPVFTDCSWSGNVAVAGGASFSEQWSTPQFVRCQFQNNTALGDVAPLGGGALYNSGTSADERSAAAYDLIDCTFTGNQAHAGGAILNYYNYKPTVPTDGGYLQGCRFEGNHATGLGDLAGGGAIKNYESVPELVRCVFQGNTADGSGGALNNELGSFATLCDCAFWENTAVEYGGAVFNTRNRSVAQCVGCVFGRNLALLGGAIYTDPNSEPTGNVAIGACQFCENGTIPEIEGIWFDGGGNAFRNNCADVDDNMLVDLTDFLAFKLALTGPAMVNVPAECGTNTLGIADYDDDSDVDLRDYARFLVEYEPSS